MKQAIITPFILLAILLMPAIASAQFQSVSGGSVGSRIFDSSGNAGSPGDVLFFGCEEIIKTSELNKTFLREGKNICVATEATEAGVFQYGNRYQAEIYAFTIPSTKSSLLDMKFVSSGKGTLSLTLKKGEIAVIVTEKSDSEGRKILRQSFSELKQFQSR